MKRVLPALFLSLAVVTSALAGQAQQPKSQLQTKRSNTPATSAATKNTAASKDKKPVLDEDQRDSPDTSDSFITEQVKRRFAAKPELKDAAITVSTKNHVVTLTGQVKDARQVLLASRAARVVKGVQTVDNKLVAASGKLGTQPGIQPVTDPKAAREAILNKAKQNK